MLNTGMKRQVLWSRFHLLLLIRPRITGKNGPDVTCEYSRTLACALLFIIQDHTCYSKPVELCDVSYVVVWHTKTSHAIRYGVNLTTFPQADKYVNRRNLMPQFDELWKHTSDRVLPLWGKRTDWNQVWTWLQHCPWIFLLPSINFNSFLTFNNFPSSSLRLCKSCME
jgi:hypothetical protein